MAQKNPDRFEHDYATSLSNYGSQLSDTGQNEEALNYSRQALEIRQRLMEQNPDRFEPDYATSLSNYASQLSGAGQNEEALNYSRQALEIRQRLMEQNPDRFEPDYATSLSNYASHLREAGQDEEALNYGRQALEIRQRLAQKNPDRFELEYARSLSNDAGDLSDAGRYEEALEHARQALEIRRQWAQKNPRGVADDLFSTTCFVQFLAWLCDQHKGGERPMSDQTMAFIPPHRLPLMLLFSAFVEAGRATDQDARANAFQRVLSNWGDLSIAIKTRGEPYWLCAAAWCARFEQADLVETHWSEPSRICKTSKRSSTAVDAGGGATFGVSVARVNFGESAYSRPRPLALILI